MAAKNRKSVERESMREELWPGSRDHVWPRPNESGWFKGPRTLPLILNMVNTKALRGKIDVGSTYLALLAENHDEGLVEIRSEADFAQLAGFTANARGLRMWRERMRKLGDIGLIKIFKRGTQEIGFVALVHPHDVVRELRDAGKLADDGMWNFIQMKVREHGSGAQKGNLVRMPARRA